MVNDGMGERRGGPISSADDADMNIPESDVIGHGLLSRFHEGCRCVWCTNQARERCCGCQLCKQARSVDPYFHLTRGVGKPGLLTAGPDTTNPEEVPSRGPTVARQSGARRFSLR